MPNGKPGDAPWTEAQFVQAEPARYTNNMAERACHVVGSVTQVGITQALGPMGKITAIFLALALASCGTLAGAGPAPSAKDILSRIATDGGHKVLWDLWQHEDEFNHMLSGIESADSSWLQVASALRPFADAGASLSIDYAVARALPKAPDRVLALTRHGFDIESICTSPFIEPAPGVAKAYEQQTLAALANVKDPALASIAVECAKRVRLPAGA